MRTDDSNSMQLDCVIHFGIPGHEWVQRWIPSHDIDYRTICFPIPQESALERGLLHKGRENVKLNQPNMKFSEADAVGVRSEKGWKTRGYRNSGRCVKVFGH